MDNCEKEEINKPSLVFVVSLPRSGSTFLTSELSRYRSIVCVPENYGPFLLHFIADKKSLSNQQLAELFLKSCDDNFLVSQEELEAAIDRSDLEQTLCSIGKIFAKRSGKDPERLECVIWKSTRLLSGFTNVEEVQPRYIVLHRNPLAIFSSQFRVDFGRANRNPMRFAFFVLTYLSVFKTLPPDRSIRIWYADTMEEIPKIFDWLKISDRKLLDGPTVIEEAMGNSKWHDGLTLPFESNDKEKVSSVSFKDVTIIRVILCLFTPLSFVFWPIRKFLDQKTSYKILLKNLHRYHLP